MRCIIVRVRPARAGGTTDSRKVAMNIELTRPLFEWDALEDSPTIRTLRGLLDSMPDSQLLGALRAHRGRGRGDYPIHVLWGTLLLKILLRHVHMVDCLSELQRNGDLRGLIGIESEGQVPKKWNMTRFQRTLGEEPHRSLLRAMFDEIARGLSEQVDDLGEQASGDATVLSAQAQGSQASSPSNLAQPAGGKKEYTDDEGRVTKMIEWFGYTLHLLIDSRHEVALAWRVTSAQGDESEEVKALVEQAEGNLAAKRMKTLTYDRAADDGDVHAFLHKKSIRPVIQNRSMWTGETERMLPGHDGTSNIVYDEAGTVYCYDMVSNPPVRRRMAYIGYEKSRGTIKYRCPAKHGGFTCPSASRCNRGKKYGKTVRVKCEVDLRRFPPIPRATKTFERLYKTRTASERVIGRLKLFWGADDGNTWGAERFHAQVGAILVAHMAFARALAERAEGRGVLSKTRLGRVMSHRPPTKKRP